MGFIVYDEGKTIFRFTALSKSDWRLEAIDFDAIIQKVGSTKAVIEKFLNIALMRVSEVDE